MITYARLRVFCILVSFYGGLMGCAGPMNDKLGKHAYEEWGNRPWNPNSSFLPPGNASPDFVLRLKAVKDYEYTNYVLNLRRGTTWGEFASDSVKIILDSLVAVTGN